MSRAARNRTLLLTPQERDEFRKRLIHVSGPVTLDDIADQTIHEDLFEILDWLPERSVDLLFADPPYNLTKSFNGRVFPGGSIDRYEAWLGSWFPRLVRTLKPTGSLYICGDLAVLDRPSPRCTAVSACPEPHNLGEREGQGSNNELEELL